MTRTALEASQSTSREARPRRPLYPQLKPGPGLSSRAVVAHQRARIRGALVELVAEHGYEGVTVRSIARLAGVSTRSFYKLFPNMEECFAYTYESLMRASLRRAYAAQTESEGWEEGVRASVQSVMEDLASHPKAARLVLVESFAAGPDMQARMRTAIGGFERLLSDSFADPEAEAVAPPRHIVRGIAGGAMRVARTTVLAGRATELEDLGGELGDWVLSLPGEGTAALQDTRRPFGPDAARRGDTGPVDAAALGEVGDERGRILNAVAKLGAIGGFSKLTIPRIRAEASVSRRSFDARFADVAECFLEAIEATAASVVTRAERNAQRATDWEGRTFRSIRTLCTEVARDPVLAQLAFLDIFTPGREGLRRKEHLVTLAAHRLRTAPPPDRQPNDLIAEASTGAAWRIAHTDIAAGRAKRLPRLAPVISYMTLAPLIGSAAAAEAIQAYA